MNTPFYDDATRDLFDEILAESVEEFRAEKQEAVSAPVTNSEQAPVSDLPGSDVEDAWKRLHRSMYVISMHRGRPHAERPEFQRKWLESALRSICVILAALPDEGTT